MECFHFIKGMMICLKMTLLDILKNGTLESTLTPVNKIFLFSLNCGKKQVTPCVKAISCQQINMPTVMEKKLSHFFNRLDK